MSSISVWLFVLTWILLKVKVPWANAANINLRVKLAYSFLQMSPLNHEAVIMITALEDELESNGLDNFKWGIRCIGGFLPYSTSFLGTSINVTWLMSLPRLFGEHPGFCIATVQAALAELTARHCIVQTRSITQSLQNTLIQCIWDSCE